MKKMEQMNARILVVDDSPSQLKILKQKINNKSYDITLVESAHQCLDTIKENIPDLILSDIIMPDMTGIELCKKLKKDENFKNIPVLLMSSGEKTEQKLEGFNAGASDYITKPFKKEELNARIEVHLKLKFLIENYKLELKKRKRADRKLLDYSMQLKKTVSEQTIELQKNNQQLLNEINERKTVQENLEKSQKKYRNLLKTIDEWIWEIDNKGAFTYSSPKVFDMLGYHPEDILGKTPFDFMAAKEAERVEKIFQNKQSKGEGVLCFENIHSHKSGQEVIIETSGVPFFDENRNLIGYRGVNRNITDRKKTEDEKIMLENQLLLSEKMASIGQLAAGVAHEINNPTGFVSSNLNTFSDYLADIKQLLKKYQNLCASFESNSPSGSTVLSEPEKLEEIIEFQKEIDIDYLLSDIDSLIDESIEGVTRIQTIVKSLKEFSHPGKDEFSYADINENIESTLNIVWNELKYKAEIKKHMEDVPKVYCNIQQINQVLLNLLVNASQAIDDKGLITISTLKREDYVEINISDTGCGIPNDNLLKIFDPFFTTKEIGKGTGLGLNLAYNIIKKHGGNIFAKSTMGQGSTFIIRLKIKPMIQFKNENQL